MRLWFVGALKNDELFSSACLPACLSESLPARIVVVDSQLMGFPPRGSVFSPIASGLEQGGVVLRISNSGEGGVEDKQLWWGCGVENKQLWWGVVLRISNSGGMWC